MDMVRVTRTKAQARSAYDRMSRRYESFAGRFEARYRDAGVELLGAQPGERILEIGYGTGKCLIQLARQVGEHGRVDGVDISSGMRDVADRNIREAGLAQRVALQVGDAAALPYADAAFDAAFASFTIELFDTPEIPEVLGEVRRVLRGGGRFAVVAMAATERPTLMMRAYIWAHRHFPNLVDCRPVPSARLLADAGFGIVKERRMPMWGLPVDVILASTPEPET